MSDMRLNSIQRRAYSLIDCLDDLCDKYQIEIEFGDACMYLHDKLSGVKVATVYETGFEIEDIEADDH